MNIHNVNDDSMRAYDGKHSNFIVEKLELVVQNQVMFTNLLMPDQNAQGLGLGPYLKQVYAGVETAPKVGYPRKTDGNENACSSLT